MRFRGKSIRRKIVALLLVPLMSLVSIWAFATAITAQDARQLLAVSAASEDLGRPAETVVHALQEERRQTLVYLADPRSAEQLRAGRLVTDDAVARLTANAAGGAAGDLGSAAVARLAVLLDQLSRLEQLRGQVDTNTITRSGAFDAYNAITDPALGLQSALYVLEDVELDRHGRAVVGLGQAAEYLARADALVAGALAAGRMTDKERRELTERIAERSLLYEVHLPELPEPDAKSHEAFWQTGYGTTLRTAETTVLEQGTAGMQSGRWQETTRTARAALRDLAIDAGDRYQDRVRPAADSVLLQAGLVGIVGLLAVLLSVAVSLRVGRGLIRDLRTLWRQARESAEVRLPSVMRRLAHGERVDVETEVPRLEYGRDEVGQVGRALNTLQRAAVEAAVQQANVRRGVSEVFVNLARRNQVLLHRQLSLLDAMERRTEDSDELADLFRLDHLTTRMRRHAEGLVILSGAAPARQWRKPVQLMDVVRAAVAEVEDYERVEVRRMPHLAVAGNAVADLTHLIAELLENATVFSPPHTAVQVVGERGGQGFALEIHDRGLGMTPEALAAANLRLAEAPDFELSDTDRLGLFVVSRLAVRHQVRVTLRESPYGGTTAVVLLPAMLLTEDADGPEERAPLPDRPAPPALLNGPVDGPVELEAPLSGRTEGRAAAPEPDTPAEHAPLAEDDPPLARRRRTPVLVAENGHPVRRPPHPSDRDVPAGAEATARPAPAAPVTTDSGLPRRVRQAGLVPQLRRAASADGREAGGADPGPAAGGPPDVDADEVRAKMASLQRGWQRGRQQNDSRPGETPSGGNGN